MCLSDTGGGINESFRHSGETQRHSDVEGTRVFNKTWLNYGQTVHKDTKENNPDVTTKISDVTGNKDDGARNGSTYHQGYY